MSAQGFISSLPARKLRLLLFVHLFWLGTICLLGAWWGKLVMNQARRISELEGSTAHLERIRRMLTWELGTFFLLLFVSSALLFWLYWRDAKRSRSLQAFFASVTHELRTPLTSIRLQAESIADNLAQDASQRHLLERLLEDTTRLEGEVNRTLELARVEGGGRLAFRQLPLKPWLERLVRSWEETYRGRAHFELWAEDVVVETDPNALQVVMRNLLENSLRHSRRDQVRVLIRAQADEKSALVAFKDDGVGFAGDPAQLGKLFEKGDRSQGAGVGLYLVRALMNQMGGEARFAAAQAGFQTDLTLSLAKSPDFPESREGQLDA